MKIIAVLLLVVSMAFAQTTHSVNLTWVDANNPAGTTYSVYRATGLCSGTPTFSKLATAIATKTYSDTTVTVGNYCYNVTATFNSAEGPASNLVNPLIAPFAVQLSVTVQ